MLGEEDNDRLTKVSPGTPMGALLRRYWHPVEAASNFEVGTIRPIRLLGEDLALYRHAEHGYGMLKRSCTHRSADLAYGFVDGANLRCPYHGWMFDASGACVEQPYEDQHSDNARFRSKCGTTGYPVRELAGLLWVYLGPEPAPVLPCFEPFTRPNGFKQIVFTSVPCNWLQCQENSIDPVHFEWLHDTWSARNVHGAAAPAAPRHLKLDFEEFAHGFVYRRVREGADESSPLWTVGRVCLWPNGLYTDDHIEWRVPIDDENTLSVLWNYERVPSESEPFEQDEVPAWTGPLIDPKTSRYHDRHVLNQDFIAWIGQGTRADRTRENLGRSDRGITKIRRVLLRDLETVARGGDPKAIIRDPANAYVELPTVDRAAVLEAPTPEQVKERHRYWAARGIDDPFIYQAGQPEEVLHAYLKAMRLDKETDTWSR